MKRLLVQQERRGIEVAKGKLKVAVAPPRKFVFRFGRLLFLVIRKSGVFRFLERGVPRVK